MTNPNILFLQVTNPGAYPPLIHAGSILAERGWKVTFLTSPSLQSSLTLPQHPNIVDERTTTRQDFTVSPSTYFAYCLAAFRLALKVRPDVIYVSDALGAAPGLLANMFGKGKLVYHEHDSPNNQRDLHPIVQWCRNQLFQAARLVIFPNAQRAEHARAEVGFDREKLKIIWNLPRRNEVVSALDDNELPRPFTLYYHGSITPDRIPLALVDALKCFAGRVRLVIAGYESGSSIGYVDQLLAAVAGTPADGCIRYLGQVPREVLFTTARDSDLGLALMPMHSDDINMAHMAGASNKAFEYMASGLMPLVSNLPEWVDLFVTPKFAVAADPSSAESLYTAIDAAINESQGDPAAKDRRRAKVSAEWNYDEVFCTQILPVLIASIQRN